MGTPECWTDSERDALHPQQTEAEDIEAYELRMGHHPGGALMDNERTIVWAAAQTGRSTHATRDNTRTLCGLEVSPAAIPAGFHLREGDPIDCRRCREAVATLPGTGNQARRTVSIG